MVPQGRHARGAGDREDRRRRRVGHGARRPAAASRDGQRRAERRCGCRRPNRRSAAARRSPRRRRILQREIAPIDDLRSTAEYRRQVAANLLGQFYRPRPALQIAAVGRLSDRAGTAGPEVIVIAARRLALVVAACVMWSAAARTQWLDYPTAGIPGFPRQAESDRAGPRAADGKPDLSGIWEVVGDRVMETDGRVRSKYVYNIAADLPGGAPFLPWAKALHDERQKALGVGAPSERCLPHGIPDAMLTRTLPFKIIQMRGVTMILYEEFNNWRQVFTDGRPLPKDPQPAWLGYSVGSWDGETFVIETAGFNDKIVARCRRHAAHRGAQNDRAPPPHRLRSHGDHVHVRRPEDVHEALVGHGEVQSASRHRTAGAPLRQREVARQAAAVDQVSPSLTRTDKRQSRLHRQRQFPCTDPRRDFAPTHAQR